MYQPLQLFINILEEKTRHTKMQWTNLKRFNRCPKACS